MALVTNHYSSSSHKFLTTATIVAFRGQQAPPTVPTNEERWPYLPPGWPRFWVCPCQRKPGGICRAISQVSGAWRWQGSSTQLLCLTTPPLYILLRKAETSHRLSGNILEDKYLTIFVASLWPVYWLSTPSLSPLFPHSCFPGIVPPAKGASISVPVF